jgi:hypothetical protein
MGNWKRSFTKYVYIQHMIAIRWSDRFYRWFSNFTEETLIILSNSWLESKLDVYWNENVKKPEQKIFHKEPQLNAANYGVWYPLLATDLLNQY